MYHIFRLARRWDVESEDVEVFCSGSILGVIKLVMR